MQRAALKERNETKGASPVKSPPHLFACRSLGQRERRSLFPGIHNQRARRGQLADRALKRRATSAEPARVSRASDVAASLPHSPASVRSGDRPTPQTDSLTRAVLGSQSSSPGPLTGTPSRTARHTDRAVRSRTGGRPGPSGRPRPLARRRPGLEADLLCGSNGLPELPHPALRHHLKIDRPPRQLFLRAHS
jgi:hypothetical protein